MFDLILKGGEIYDGTGAAARSGDIAVKDGKIAGIGEIDEVGTAQVIDVSGLAVSPGFIDMHTHSDFTLIADCRAESQVHQGVTTEVIGQCGISCAPVCSHKDIRSVSPWYVAKPDHPQWHGFGEYLDTLGQCGLGVNVVAFVGHGTVHRAVLGDELRAGEPDEIAAMSRLVDQAMDEGAGGFSSGLEYFPGIMASPEHLVPMCGIAAKYGRLYEKIKANPQPMWLIVKARQWRDIVLLNATENKDIVGADFEEIGKMRGVDPYDAVLDILLEEGENGLSTMWSSKSFRDDDIDLCLAQEECAVISDTVAIANDGILKDHVGSLSGYGWAARFLQYYVRDRNVLSLAQGLRKITSLPADRLGIKNRGRLHEGYSADICVFDPANIASNCSARHPRRYASGIAHVFVNGKPSMKDGTRTDVNAGEVIRDFAA